MELQVVHVVFQLTAIIVLFCATTSHAQGDGFDNCSPNPCQFGGTCIDGVDSFTCQCVVDITGDRCETVIEVILCTEGSYKTVDDGDPAKSLYCGPHGVWYQLECPCDQVYNPETNICGPPECRAVFLAPSLVPTGDLQYVTNPCTYQSELNGLTQFGYDPDPSRFIKCDGEGNATVKPCPPFSAWKEETRQCELVETTPPNPLMLHVYQAPCTQENVERGKTTHPHEDSSMFILCDYGGASHVVQCPPGETYSKRRKACIVRQ